MGGAVGNANPLNKQNKGVTLGTTVLSGGMTGLNAPALGALNGMTGGGVSGVLGSVPIVGGMFRPGGMFGGEKEKIDTAGVRPDIPQLQNNIINQWGDLDQKYRINGKTPAGIQPGKVVPGSITAGTVTAGQLDPTKLAANQDALNALKARAMSTGDSPWLKMQLEKQNLDQLDAMDKAGGSALGSAATARNMLAMKGGLGSGARERIATSSARDLNATRQGIGRGGQMDRLNLGIADDQTKTGLLAQIPGMDLANAEYNAGLDKFNIGTRLDTDKFNTGNALDASKYNAGMAFDADKYNTSNALDASKYNTGMQWDATKTDMANTLGGIEGVNKFNMAKYGEQMKGYAAEKSGDAVANGGKK